MNTIIKYSTIIIGIILFVKYFLIYFVSNTIIWFKTLTPVTQLVLSLSLVVYFIIGMCLITTINILNNPETSDDKFNGLYWTGDGFENKETVTDSKNIYYKILIITIFVDLFCITVLN